MVTVTARAKAKKGSEAKLHMELLTVAKETRSESGCVSYKIFQDSKDPTIVMTYEIWKSEADIHTHFQKPYIQHLFALVPDLCEGIPEITTWLPLES